MTSRDIVLYVTDDVASMLTGSALGGFDCGEGVDGDG